MDFVKTVLKQTEQAEPPAVYFYWATLAAIAAVTKGQIWLDRHFYKLYPNIYVLLVGKSGLRKSAAIAFAKKLVRVANNTRVISGRNTIEGVISDLARDFTLEGGTIIKRATGFMVASEFTSLLQENDAALDILTDLYDTGYHEEGWKNTLKTSGSETLRGVNLTMLGATNLPHLENRLQSKDIMGGFIARTYLINATRKRCVNSLVRKPDALINYKHLAVHLDVIKSMKGEFTWEDDALDYYDSWYNDYNKQQEERDETNPLSEDTGAASRFEDHVLKVAMLLAIARHQELNLTVNVIKESVEVCFEFLQTTENLMLTGKRDNKNIIAEHKRNFLIELFTFPRGEYITQAKMMRKMWKHSLSVEDLNKIAKLFEVGGIIEIKGGRAGVRYKLVDSVWDQMKGEK